MPKVMPFSGRRDVKSARYGRYSMFCKKEITTLKATAPNNSFVELLSLASIWSHGSRAHDRAGKRQVFVVDELVSKYGYKADTDGICKQ